MVNAALTLTWPDGRTASAALVAESAERDYPITYSGSVDLVAGAPRLADLPFLSWSLRQIAELTGARFEAKISGEYDRMAGGKEGL